MQFRRLLREQRGAAAAEMALIVPGIAFVLLNVVDLASYIYLRMQVDLAAHEAAGAARVECDQDSELPTSNCPNRDSKMQAAVQSTSLGNRVSLVSGSTSDGYYCANATGTLVAVTATTANCSGTVAGSTSTPGIYLQTRVTFTYSPVFPGASVASLLPTTITRTAWMRLK